MKCEEQILELLAVDGSANVIIFIYFPKQGKKGEQRKQHFHVFCVIYLYVIDSYLGKRA